MCMHPHEVLRGATSALHCASLPPSPTPSHSRPQPMLSRHLTDSPPLASSPSLSSESPPSASSLRRPGRGVRSSSAVQILLSPHVEEKRDNRRKERNQVDRNNAQRQSSATTPPRSCGSPSTSLSVHTPGSRRGSAVLNACYAPPPAASLAESEGGACAENASQGGRPPEVNVREERDIQEGEDSAGTVATEITLLDMAGHPKYIKSALTGLLRECLGHVVLVLDASPEAAPLQVQLQEERVLLATSLILLRLPFTLVFNKWERRNCGIRTDTNNAGSAPAFSEPCASSVSLVGAEEGTGAEAASMRLSGVSRETKNRWGKRKEGERWRPNATAEAEEKAQLCAEVLGNLQAMFRVAGAVLEDSCLHRLSGPDGRAKHFCKREETKKVGEEAGEIEEEKVPTKAAEMARDPLVSSGSPRGLDGTGQRLLKHPRRRPRTATAKENCAVLLRTCLLSQRREQAREDGSNERRERCTDEGRRREGDPSFTANLGVTTSRWFPLTCRGAFCVSCVNGQGIEQLRWSLQELSPWVPAEAKASVSRDACIAPHGFSFKPRFAPLVSDEGEQSSAVSINQNQTLGCDNINVHPNVSLPSASERGASSFCFALNCLPVSCPCSRLPSTDRASAASGILLSSPSSSSSSSFSSSPSSPSSSSCSSPCSAAPSSSPSSFSSSSSSSSPSSSSASVASPVSTPSDSPASSVPADSFISSSCGFRSSRSSGFLPSSRLPPAIRSAFLVTEVFSRCRATVEPREENLFSDNSSATTTVHPRPRVVCRPPLSSAFSGDERGDSRQEAECTDAASVEEQESEQDEKGLGAVLGGMLLQGRLNVGDCVLCGPLLSPSLSVSSGGSFPPFLSPPGVPRRPVETGDSVAKLHAMGEREENTDALHDGEAWRRGEREEENGESTGGEDEIDDGEIEEPSGGASFLWFWARVKSLRDSARQAVTFLPDTATPMKCSLAAVFLSDVAPVEDVPRQFANRKDSQRERRRQRGTNEGMKWEEGKEEQAGQEEEAGTEGKGREEGRERESDDAERRRSIATERTHREEGLVKLLRPGLLLVCVNAEREKRLFPGGFLESTKEETERRCAGGHCPLACMRGRGNLGCRPSPLPPEAEQVETFNKAAFRRQLIPSLPMPVAACWCRLHILAHPSELRKNNTLVVYTHAVRQAAEVLSILPLSASWHELMGVTANALACVNERMQFRSRVTKWGIQAQRRCRPDKEDERREREIEEGKTSTARRSCIRAGRKNRCLRSLSEAATSVGGRSGPVTLAPFDTGLVLLQFISEFGGELLASGLPIVVCSGVDVQGVGHVVAPCPQIPFFSQRFLVS
ncbi:hypothetical protein TGPRC2_255290 [Toxoplasma gondii TgCatPRC2]|uniref:Elongation factor Tu GTP binding domain-containing protein n=1 Tax=Toxoplasma gondii TgCatPRC2 TaxID=1130821 RepID=A0A151HEL2_TOXGO|nr:hypothetical protein TGPRC2_255290 [Toxoplasma gondii TgCatPRC2]